MTGGYSEFCAPARSQAASEAARFLGSAGFSGDGEGRWTGELTGPEGRSVSVTVSLPPSSRTDCQNCACHPSHLASHARTSGTSALFASARRAVC